METDEILPAGFQRDLVLIGHHQNPLYLCSEMIACTVGRQLVVLCDTEYFQDNVQVGTIFFFCYFHSCMKRYKVSLLVDQLVC